MTVSQSNTACLGTVHICAEMCNWFYLNLSCPVRVSPIFARKYTVEDAPLSQHFPKASLFYRQVEKDEVPNKAKLTWLIQAL